MSEHDKAAREFLHSSAWLNAGDIFSQEKALAAFAASIAPQPSGSHDETAREIVRLARVPVTPAETCVLVSVGVLDVRISAALARVERETIERCAKVAENHDLYRPFNTDVAARGARNGVAAAIRALSGGSST